MLAQGFGRLEEIVEGLLASALSLELTSLFEMLRASSAVGVARDISASTLGWQPCLQAMQCLAAVPGAHLS